MLIQNISFIIVLDREEDLLGWLRGILPEFIAKGGLNPRLSILRTVAGANEVQSQSQTIAFQLEFCDKESLDEWKEEALITLVRRFEDKFGPEAIAFTSVFETLPL